jgi:hypothetical protein
MADSSEPQWIMFIADTETRDKLQKFARGSQWQVDPNTAAALILAGFAVRTPPHSDTQPVPGVSGMSLPRAESA